MKCVPQLAWGFRKVLLPELSSVLVSWRNMLPAFSGKLIKLYWQFTKKGEDTFSRGLEWTLFQAVFECMIFLLSECICLLSVYPEAAKSCSGYAGADVFSWKTCQLILYPSYFGLKESNAFQRLWNRWITGYDCLAFRHVIFSERHLCQIRGNSPLCDAVKKNRSTYSSTWKHQLQYMMTSQTKQRARFIRHV